MSLIFFLKPFIDLAKGGLPPGVFLEKQKKEEEEKKRKLKQKQEEELLTLLAALL